MVDKGTSLLIRWAFVSCLVIVNVINGQDVDVCDDAIKKLQLPAATVGSCKPVLFSYIRDYKDSVLNISVQSLEGKKIDLLNLKVTEGILANERTPIFIVDGDSSDDGTNPFVIEEKKMNAIGDFKFYQNYDIRTSCELYTDEFGENIYGAVGRDAIFVGNNLDTNDTVNSTTNIHGKGALITFANQKDIFNEGYIRSEYISTNESAVSNETAYPELLVVIDHSFFNQMSDVELLRKLLLYFNSADMTFSPLQSPRVKLNIANVVILKNTSVFSYLYEPTDDNSLRVNNYTKFTKNLYNDLSSLKLRENDYTVVFTQDDLCKPSHIEYINGYAMIKQKYNTNLPLDNSRINETVIVNINTTIPTQQLIVRKLIQLMGVKLTRKPKDKTLPDKMKIQTENPTILTTLTWSDNTKKQLHDFYESSAADVLWADPREKPANLPRRFLGENVTFPPLQHQI